ncbi:hypothetical protein ATO13_22236 [Stappia sp. 22II-S9-Z10]|nr:hypothetical protein ATO13_22236 [Stappia sp. 22II-S9-Z10]
MSARLGKHQLLTLAFLARPGTMLISGATPASRALVERGLCAAAADGNEVTITAAGLRRLADEADKGRVDLRPGPDFYRRQDL